mmetsp:Transcript_11574/g.34642  ORF Transcript_11574/g.34642 Transcript_11574/m.34642 type:complete len:87 (-) Transcript_11574:659-919(-)
MRPSVMLRAASGGPEGPAWPNVWTPSGGWFVNPPNWKRNTGIAFAFMGCVFVYVFCKSAQLESRPMAPKHDIPSARWAKVLPVEKD